MFIMHFCMYINPPPRPPLPFPVFFILFFFRIDNYNSASIKLFTLFSYGM